MGAPRIDRGAARRPTVLIVDDDEAMRTLLRVAIEMDEGAVIVGEADDGLAAIAGARRTQPDVVVLDAMMPNLSGIDAIPAIRAVARSTRIIVFSASTDGDTQQRAIRAGADLFVSKADPIGDLLAAVRNSPVHVVDMTDEVVEGSADPADERTAPEQVASPAPAGRPGRRLRSRLGR